MNVIFDLRKKGEETWQRLTFEQKKFFWLKIDFDKVHYTDSEDENKPEFDDMKQFDDFLKTAKHEKPSSRIDFKTMYLFLFSMCQWIGYNYVILGLLACMSAKESEGNCRDYFSLMYFSEIFSVFECILNERCLFSY